MIQNLHIEGFKRFGLQTFSLRNLTVLAGRNGAGKTSVIHSLLLIQNAMQRGDGIAELNGPFGLELGWFEELLNSDAKDNSFSVSLTNDVGEYGKWIFSEGDTELYASVRTFSTPVSPLDGSATRNFQYLAAERVGPRITQRASVLPSAMIAVGSKGEFSAHVLDKLGGSKLDVERLFTGSENPPLLKAQTEHWLSSVTREIQIDTARFSGSDITSLTFRAPGGLWVRPTNMGFGVSYALPVILGALTATKGGVFIVENPEAHLHPAGQSEMGTFLAKMASAGIQVIVETHSDHLLNGFRRAIGSQILRAQDAIVHFFGDVESPIRSLEFTPTGGISEWPAGFFDQYQLDISKITKIKRRL